MNDEEYVWDFEYQEKQLKKLEAENPFIAAFSAWLVNYDYDDWKEAVMPEEGPDGYDMAYYASLLLDQLTAHGIQLVFEK